MPLQIIFDPLQDVKTCFFFRDITSCTYEYHVKEHDDILLSYVILKIFCATFFYFIKFFFDLKLVMKNEGRYN